MVAQQQRTGPMPVYYQMETSNKSFIEMHYFLKAKGIKNNKFFMILYDRDLAGIDPRDPRLNETMKAKVLRECMVNIWYFLREIVRIPIAGGEVNGGTRYKLHRGNLALTFGFMLNWNMFLELPRQHGKTVSALCIYLWVYNFGTTNSEMMFMNKKHDDSKMNLARMKEIRSALPRYLRMDEMPGRDGKPQKIQENVITMTNPYNHNKISTKPGARNKANANSIGRGCTMPIHWYDEYAFILHNSIIYAAATPAFSTASANAKRNGAPYGILITTTPGDLTTDEGMDAYETKNAAIPFKEQYYDFTLQQLRELQATNTDSSFFYIRFTYRELGSGEDYFKEICITMKKNWPAIRREVLLEWSTSSDNSPFTKQDLDIVKSLIKEPIMQIPLGVYYFMDLYKPMAVESIHWPPLIGVDVSGGYSKDSSAITVVDSRTTETVACLNCNYISIPDLAKVIYELVVKHMPNAIVNIERTGGFGSSVIAQLLKTKIKRNLYYEIKDRVLEERTQGVHIQKMTRKVKVYGYDETKANRDLLMEILRDRMTNHKAKFISPIIYDELCTLEVKKNGRIEHSANAHDDQIFSYLLALYIWYEGKDLMERFGLQKGTITTDDDDTVELGVGEEYTDIARDMQVDTNDIVNEQKEFFKSAKSVSYNEWLDKQRQESEQADDMLRNNPRTRKAWYEHNHLVDDGQGAGMYTIPNQVFDSWYAEEPKKSKLQQEFDNITNIR